MYPIRFFRNNKFGADDTTSRDSDSLIQEYINVPPSDLYTHCWNHPKIRENWRTVLAAVTLLIIGIGLLTMGVISIAAPANGSRGFVFLLAGMCAKETLNAVLTLRLYTLSHKQSLFSPTFNTIDVDWRGHGFIAPNRYVQSTKSTGFICFIPGAYHVVYIWLAAIGYRDYNFYHLPLFT